MRRRPSSHEPTLEDLGRRLPGEVGNFLVVPDPNAQYFPGSTVRAVGMRFTRRGELFLPESASRPPQPIDLVGSYLTYAEVIGRYAGLEYVREALQLVPRNLFIESCARLLGDYEAMGANRREVDRAVVAGTLAEPTATRVQDLLDGGNRALLSPQSLLLLMQLALLHSPEVAPEGARPRPFIGVVLALQDGLGQHERMGAEDGPQVAERADRHVFRGETESPLFRSIVASQAFAAWPDPVVLMARHHLHWEQLPTEAATQPGRVDLAAMFEEATGVSKHDFQAVGAALWGYVEVHRRYPAPATVFDAFSLDRRRIDAALELFVAAPDRLRDVVSNLEERYRTEWSFDTLRRFPVMRTADGGLLVLSRTLLLERIFGWLPVFDLESGLRQQGRHAEASRAVNWFRAMCELDARRGLEVIAPAAAGIRRIYGEDDIQRAYPGVRNADAAIDYGDAWVVIEISTRKLTRATTIALEPEALAEDLRMGVDDKVEQLDATIRQLMNDESRLTGVQPQPRRRYVSVLVMTEGFPTNPMTMTAVHERLSARSLLADARIGPLHIVDQEEMTMVEAIVERSGPSLLDLLEGHEHSTLRNAGLRDYLIRDFGRGEGPEHARRLEAPFQATWQPVFERMNETQPIVEEDSAV